MQRPDIRLAGSPRRALARGWLEQPLHFYRHRPPTSLRRNLPYVNPMGGAVTITRTGVGAYTVRWTAVDGEIRDFGNAQLTAWGFNNAQCRLSGYSLDAAHVACYGPTGAPMDTYYTVLLGS